MTTKHPFRFVALVVLLISTAFAQPIAPTAPSPADRVALYQALMDLTNPWTVMCVAAHPDDEDGTSLVVMRRKYGAHTVSLFSTFGEGGQNAIGPELYEELGAIRVRETMAASEIQGSEPHFLGLKDFGFSKSADETFKEWGHEEALRRMVLQIRKLRPDVIITNHSVTSSDHGHHQATARLVVEAFDAAADPNRFREQVKAGAEPWQVRRLFVRVRGSQNQPDNASIVTIDPNERDPIRGVSFAEQALSALQKHATQGPWPKTVTQLAMRFTNSPDFRLPLIRYRLAREANGAEALPPDSHNFLDGMHLPTDLASQFQAPTIDGRPLTDFVDDRRRLLAALITPTKALRVVGDIQTTEYHRLRAHSQAFNEAVRLASGLNLAITADREVATPGSVVKLDMVDSNNGDMKVKLDTGVELRPHTTSSKRSKVEVINEDWEFTSDPLLRDRERDLKFTVTHRAQIEGLVIRVPATTRVTVVPLVEITLKGPSPIVVTPSENKSGEGKSCGFRDFDLKIHLENNQDKEFSGQLMVARSESGPGREIASTPVVIPAHAQTDSAFTVSPCSFSVTSGPSEGSKSLAVILKPKIPTRPSTGFEVPIVSADARTTANLHVGYIRGFDFSLPNALNALGVTSKELTVGEVKTADLSKFTTIIVDNRVYESQPELIGANQKLLDFANNGGTLIVFYHKSDEWNPDPKRNRPQLAPYKLIVSNDRVTDENAPISFIEPDHPLLNSPNKLSQEDFVGWIQERGVNYPKEWDAQFHALLQSNDPGEAPLKGALLVADYGKGRYIYTSMVWYRQLRAGVPGAYRMLANMISYGRSK